MAVLKVGIIGGGLITQVEHLPNLLGLPDRFSVAGVADPSAKVRARLAERYGIATFETAEALLDQPLDCVVVATPDSYHAEIILQALSRGLHVFTEKPLCYGVTEADEIVAARDRAGKVVQVGYMKRFDPAYLKLCQLLEQQQGPLRSVNVETIDPDHLAFTAHRELIVGGDVSPELIAEGAARRARQVEAALAIDAPQAGAKGFAGPYSSSLVHDLNLVQGLLAVRGISFGEPIGAAFFAADGDGGGYLSARLKPVDAIASLTWVAAPKLSYYCERISLVFDDAAFELRFPAPYLNHEPTGLIERRADGLSSREINHRVSYAEPFVIELVAWHHAMTTGKPVVNTGEQARTDMSLLAQFARRALARR